MPDPPLTVTVTMVDCVVVMLVEDGVTATVGVMSAGPDETTRLTAEPGLTLAPALGLSLITSPDATVALDCVVTVPTTS